MRIIHASFSQKRLKKLGSMPVIIPVWLLAGWLGHPSTGYAPVHWTRLLGIGDVYPIGVSRLIHDPAGQPASYQNSKSLLDYLNA
ncbi:hypothetical protein HAQ01_08180 [Acidithiobacillus thiooxidans]|uniref:hypothetical protein n=1 Tax=Acidithiobacillus TaxID=119977 RepID=UPI001C070B9F|nr:MULTISPECIES: hypothetical protein [Acidithiobacillus]MBU2740219.1 hypothetical protein [Acidithiobacillus albertensis]MBU2793362.1 hypothetical protein [Acidithiobacillus thiooxidans]